MGNKLCVNRKEGTQVFCLQRREWDTHFVSSFEKARHMLSVLKLKMKVGHFFFCIEFNVPFNTFQVILVQCLLVTEGMITTL